MEVRPGYKRTDAGAVPEDWEASLLGEVSQSSSGTTPSRALHERYYRLGSTAWVKTLDLNNGPISATAERVTDAALAETSLRLYPVGTVLVAMYGGFQQIGRTGILHLPATVNQALTAVRTNANALVPEYLLATLNFRVGYWKSVASSSRKDPNITGNDVRRFPIAFPAPHEQSAIATALTDSSVLLAGLDRLIAKKRDLKQAAMQQLLTGQTRLPGFQGEWGVKQLGAVTDIDPENLGADTSVDFTFNYVSLEDVDRGSLRSHSEHVFATAPSRARRKLKSQDVLVSTVRPNLQSHLLFEAASSNWICSTGFCVVRCRDGTTNPAFVLNHFFAGHVNRQIDALLTGSNYPAINSADVRAIEIPFPPYAEQTAIATVLSDMDAELAALEARRDKTRALQQGMMQELLTGRTRLV